MATDYLVVTLGFTFIIGLIFTILGFFDEWPRNVTFYMFGMLGWIATMILSWMSDETAIVGVPWIFFFFALMDLVLIILNAFNFTKLDKRKKRGFE